MLNIAAMERDLVAKQTEGKALLAKTATLAETENRVFTDEEKAALETLATEGRTLRAKIERAKGDQGLAQSFEELTAGLANDGGHLARREQPRVLASMGQQFVQSEMYQEFFKKGGHRTSASWRSPSIELYDRVTGYRGGPDLRAATLTEDPASGGALVLPDYQSGILPILFKRLVVADLLASGTTGSNLISYMKELTFTNAAATVLEAAAKPESAMTFSAVTDPVRKIAHWLPVTEEMLEDVAQIRSYIDARLRLGVQLVEETQLLAGDGIAPNILGLRNRVGLAVDVVRAAAENNADAIFRQIMAIYSGSFLMPDGVIVNPADWAVTALMKTTTGEYLAGGPFSSIPAATLWGLPVAVTPSITATVALVGAFKTAAQVFRNGGLRVEASNSHQDYFIKNLVAIRAEERLALAVYRPQAIGEVTGLGVPA